MPLKPEKMKVYLKKYAKKNADKLAEAALLRHQTQREDRKKRMEKRNRAEGAKPRPKGPKAKPEIKVPVYRRWWYHNERIYFTSLRGFEPSEVRVILKEVRDLVAAKVK